MPIIIDGKILASKIYDDIVKGVQKKNGYSDSCNNKRPNLAIILVGDREDSKIYVDIKQKQAKRVGIDTHFYKLSKIENVENILQLVNYLNNDDKIDGILIQLPLPGHLDTNLIVNSINPQKDVDGFHPKNLEKFSIIPPLFSVVDYILDVIQYDISDKKVGIVAKPNPFGDNLARFLKQKCCVVEVIDPKKQDFLHYLKDFDVLITAIGQAHIIKKEMIKDQSVIIDMGIVKKNGKIYGDVDFEDVKDKVSYITSVPGGVGPLTVAFALLNTFNVWKK